MYEYSIDTGYVLVKKGNSHDKHSPSQKSLYKKAPVKKARIKKAAAMGGLSHGSVRFC